MKGSPSLLSISALVLLTVVSIECKPFTISKDGSSDDYIRMFSEYAKLIKYGVAPMTTYMDALSPRARSLQEGMDQFSLFATEKGRKGRSLSLSGGYRKPKIMVTPVFVLEEKLAEEETDKRIADAVEAENRKIAAMARQKAEEATDMDGMSVDENMQDESVNEDSKTDEEFKDSTHIQQDDELIEIRAIDDNNEGDETVDLREQNDNPKAGKDDKGMDETHESVEEISKNDEERMLQKEDEDVNDKNDQDENEELPTHAIGVVDNEVKAFDKEKDEIESDETASETASSERSVEDTPIREEDQISDKEIDSINEELVAEDSEVIPTEEKDSIDNHPDPEDDISHEIDGEQNSNSSHSDMPGLFATIVREEEEEEEQAKQVSLSRSASLPEPLVGDNESLVDQDSVQIDDDDASSTHEDAPVHAHESVELEAENSETMES